MAVSQIHCELAKVFHEVCKSKVKVNGVSQLATRLTATGTHMPYGITQYYLPPGRGDIQHGLRGFIFKAL